MKTVFLFISVGFLAGFVNGLFGTGGAIPVLALMTYLCLPADHALATSNALVMFLSLVSLYLYSKNGTLPNSFLSDFMKKGAFFQALVGGAVGSLLLSRLSSSFLKKLFCLVTMVGGVGMVFK